MKGKKPWDGFRAAQDQKTGRNDEIESRAPPDSIDLYFSCLQQFPLDLDFPSAEDAEHLPPGVHTPPTSPAESALAKVASRAVLATANHILSQLPRSSSSSSSFSSSSLSLSRFSSPLPFPYERHLHAVSTASSSSSLPWVVIMSAYPPIPTEVAYLLFFHQPPNHLQEVLHLFHKHMQTVEQEHLADQLDLYRPYGEEGKAFLEKWKKQQRQQLRQRQIMQQPWWEERGEDAREGELHNILGYHQYTMLIRARNKAKQEAVTSRMYNSILSDRHGNDLQDITEWLLDEEKRKRLTPKVVRQFIEDVEDRSRLLRQMDLEEPIASLLQERERLEGADVSDRPSLRDRKALLNRTGGGVERKMIENATDLDPVSRALLLQFHDSKIKVNNPILWMKQIHEEKKKSRKHVERFSPLFEMFLLHARVNLQKSPPPDDVPSYDEWRQQEGSARRRTSGRTGRDIGSIYPSSTPLHSRKPIVDPLEYMLDHLPEGTSDFLQDSSDETVSTQALRNLQREMTTALLPPGSRREGMLDEYVNLKDLHPEIPELTELAGGKGANQRCEVFLPLVVDNELGD